jgi:micrococcal nuclease
MLPNCRLTLGPPLLLFALLFIPALGDAQRGLTGDVVRVVDGDTVHVRLADGSYHVCRLVGIDTPEAEGVGAVAHPGQPLARAAAEYLTYLLRPPIGVTLHGKDRYGRSLCWLESGGRAVNEELVRAGFAEVYRGPDDNPYRQQLEDAEREARASARGIWRLLDYESPREFRSRLRKQEVPR